VPFAALDLHPKLVSGIKKLKYERPTPIQEKAIPAALEGRDVLATAMTGSGKTAAFLLPMLNGIIGKKSGTTRALILTPTRELAAQILEDLQDLSVHAKITGAAIYGGVGMRPQENAFRRGVDVLVACPGRLLDHFQYSYARLDGLEYLVLDEADRMLDMGFLPDIRRILKQIPRERQTMFFSATMPPEIIKLTREMLVDPATIALQRTAAPATGITQAIFPVPAERKTGLLLHLLEHHDLEQALVFTRTKHRANRVAKFLVKHGIEAERIHGNRSQPQRTEALRGFKNGKYRVLVATDIAARGIDVEALSHVVNFDVPKVAEDYIHRVGRTARAEATGEAFTFVSPEEENDLRKIERAVKKKLPRRRVDGFNYSARIEEKLEIPIGERLAAHRAKKSEDRARAAAKTEPRATRDRQETPARPAGNQAGNQPSGNRRRRRRRSGPAR